MAFFSVDYASYLAGVDHSALAVITYYAPYYMNHLMAPISRVSAKHAYLELFENKEFRK